MEINEDKEIDHEEEEEEEDDEQSITFSCASIFNQQLVIFAIFFHYNLIII